MKIAAATLSVLSVAQIAAADVRLTPLVRPALTRTVDGRIEATKSTADEAEVRRWLTALETVSEYYVRVRARTRPHDSMIFWPWDSGLVSTNANFTFIP